MGASTTHAKLVNSIVDWIQSNCGPSAQASVLVDSPDTQPGNTPPAIGGYIPDVFLKSEPPLIGEAKTAKDIETKHSRDQYAAFLKYLSIYKDAVFVLAVPWHMVPQARSLITRVQKIHNAENVRTVFIDKLPG